MNWPRGNANVLWLLTTAVWLFVTGVSAWGAFPLGTSFTFQGSLKQDGSPVNDTCGCQFSLWDDPDAGGQVGPTVTFDGVDAISVINGLFSVELDFGVGVFTGEARWLEIRVACPIGGVFQPLSPRQPVTATPFALYALNGPGAGQSPWQVNGGDIHYTGGRVGIGTASPGHVLHVETDANENAIMGRHTAGSLTRIGVAGESASSGGRGVFGLASSTIGLATGVWGQNSSTTGGRGVLGLSGAATGATFGVFGQSNSVNGTGVYGYGLSASGTTRGVHGEVNSPDGYAGYFEGGRNYFEGRVGIGTTNPAPLLHVQDGDAGVASHSHSRLVVERNARVFVNLLTPEAAEGGLLFGNPSGGSAAGGVVYNSAGAPQGLQFRVNGNSTKMTITSTGAVGMGTTAPQADLHVRGTSDVGELIVTPGTSDAHAQIRLTENTSASLGAVMKYDGTANQWQVLGRNGGGETAPHLVVGRDHGRVGVGTTSPADLLHVNGTARIEGGISLPATTRYLTLSAASFELGRNDFGDLSVRIRGFDGHPALANENDVGPLGNGVRAFANVSLPHGSTVTRLSAWMRDFATQNLVVELKRKEFGSPDDFGSELLAQVSSIDSTGAQVRHDDTISFPVIDAERYVYWVSAHFPPGTPAADLQVWGVRITYTVESPLP